jgi:hypothetical protein
MYAARENDKVRSMIAKKMNLTFEDAACNGCRNQKGMCSVHSHAVYINALKRRDWVLVLNAPIFSTTSCTLVPIKRPYGRTTQKSSIFV